MTRRTATTGSHAGLMSPATTREAAPAGPVRPGRYLRPAELRGLKNLLFVARTLVEGLYAGPHRSRSRGHSIEFADYREYCPGDDIGDIDWKAYGRSDRLFVRLFEAHTNMLVYPLLDCSGSMGYAGAAVGEPGEAPLSKFEYSCYLLAALSFLVIKQGDRIGLGLFRERLEDFAPPGGTFGHLYGLLNRLEHVSPVGRTNVSSVLREAFGAMKPRGLLIVLSDFLEEPAAIFDALGPYRHRGFEIILFHVLHEDELHLPRVSNARFVDSETGESLTIVPADVREDYERRIAAHIDALRAGCRARRIDYNVVTTATSYYDVLGRYLAKRTATGI